VYSYRFGGRETLQKTEVRSQKPEGKNKMPKLNITAENAKNAKSAKGARKG